MWLLAASGSVQILGRGRFDILVPTYLLAARNDLGSHLVANAHLLLHHLENFEGAISGLIGIISTSTLGTAEPSPPRLEGELTDTNVHQSPFSEADVYFSHDYIYAPSQIKFWLDAQDTVASCHPALVSDSFFASV